MATVLVLQGACEDGRRLASLIKIGISSPPASVGLMKKSTSRKSAAQQILTTSSTDRGLLWY